MACRASSSVSTPNPNSRRRIGSSRWPWGQVPYKTLPREKGSQPRITIVPAVRTRMSPSPGASLTKVDHHLSGWKLVRDCRPGTIRRLHPEMVEDVRYAFTHHRLRGRRHFEVQVRHVRISRHADACQDLAAADAISSLHAHAAGLQVVVM